VVVLPFGLAGLVFSKSRYGGHRHLAAIEPMHTLTKDGPTQRIAIDRSHDAQLPR
jgi:hypothetical protein